MRTLALTATAVLFVLFSLTSVFGAENEEIIIYEVKQGDTLTNIANQYDTTVEDIVRLNEIKDINKIVPGMQLKIPKNASSEVKGPDKSETNSYETTEEPQYKIISEADKLSEASYDDIIMPYDTVISLRFENSDIRDVLSALSLSTGVGTVYIGKPVLITLNLDGVSSDEAFSRVAAFANLECRRLDNGNNYIIASAEQLDGEISSDELTAEINLTSLSRNDFSAYASAAGFTIDQYDAEDSEADIIKVKGGASTLIRLRTLVNMLESKNTDSDPKEFYTMKLKHTDSAFVSRMLFSLGLPAGAIGMSDDTLYLYESSAVYAKTLQIKEVVDSEQGQIKFMRADIIRFSVDDTAALLTEKAGVRLIKKSPEGSVWISGTNEQITLANEILTVLSSEESELSDFRIISTDFISSSMLAEAMQKLGYPIGTVFEKNKNAFFVFADDELYTFISDVKNAVDRDEFASGFVTSDGSPLIFSSYELEHADKTSVSIFLSAIQSNVRLVNPISSGETAILMGSSAEVKAATNHLNWLDRDGYIENSDYFTYTPVNITPEQLIEEMRDNIRDGYRTRIISGLNGEKSVLISCPSKMSDSLKRLISLIDIVEPI